VDIAGPKQSGPLRGSAKVTGSSELSVSARLPTASEYAEFRMCMHLLNTLNPADPVDLGAQSDLIGAPEPMSVEAVLAVPNGG
jgi:hypothetical protein